MTKAVPTDRLIKRLKSLTPPHAVWAMGDQGIVSLGNFAANIILARNMSTSEFGVFVLLFSIFVFLNGIQDSFVNYPLAINVAKKQVHDVEHLAGSALLLTTALIVPLSAGVILAVMILDRPSLAPWAVMAMGAWQLQGTTRRALMAQLRYRDTIPGDSISYLGQAVSLLALNYLDYLSLEAVFALMAATSVLAAVVQAAQIGVRISHVRTMRPFVRSCWDLGRWVVLGNLVALFQRNAFGWTLAIVHGVEETAMLRAAVNVLGISHPAIHGVSNLIVPMVAHAHREGMASVLRVAFKYGFMGSLFILPYFLALAIWPEPALVLFYGAGSPYTALDHVVRVFVIVYCIRYVSILLASTLGGIEKPNLTFRAQLFGSVTAVCVGLPLAAWGGVLAGAFGIMLTQAVVLLSNSVFLRRVVLYENTQCGARRVAGDAE